MVLGVRGREGMKQILSIIVIVSAGGIQSKNPDKPIFKKESPFKKEVHFVHNADNFFKAVDRTSDFLQRIHLSSFMSCRPGVLGQYGITVDDVKDTLAFVQQTMQQLPEKMADPVFLEQNFDFHRWYVKSDHGHTLHGHYGPPDYIRTTTYLITQIPGSTVKTSQYNFPLYSVPQDEALMKPAQIEQNKNHLLRFVFTRQEIMNEVFKNSEHVTLLAWVTLEDYKELVKQGSAVITFQDGSTKLCRVAKHNQKKGDEQYYFFSIEGGSSRDPKKTKFPIKPEPVAGVTLAGNIEGLGLGKLFLMVNHNHGKNTLEGRFGLLTDTGSAFKDNFHQVDMFAGYFSDKKSFQSHILGLPHTARMYLMIKKRG